MIGPLVPKKLLALLGGAAAVTVALLLGRGESDSSASARSSVSSRSPQGGVPAIGSTSAPELGSDLEASAAVRREPRPALSPDEDGPTPAHEFAGVALPDLPGARNPFAFAGLTREETERFYDLVMEREALLADLEREREAGELAPAEYDERLRKLDIDMDSKAVELLGKEKADALLVASQRYVATALEHRDAVFGGADPLEKRSPEAQRQAEE